MKKKINRQFVGVTLFTILTTTIIMTVGFYSLLKKQVFSDLASIANVLCEENDYKKHVDGVRITIIEKDGRVSYDSSVEAEKMSSHLDRPEIVQAMKHGTGSEVRMSDTLSENVFYYAKQLDTGEVVRVGKTSHSILSVLGTILPLLLLMAVLVAAICFVLAHFLTIDIVKPIDGLVEDLDHIDEHGIYEELIPFTRKIRMQHEEILSSANMRQEFTANVSHELKTPLTVILGYAELMESGMVSQEDVMHFSEEIRKSASRLLNLINDIIKLSQLDEGELERAMEPVNLAEIARETVEMLSMVAAKNHITIYYDGCEEAYVRLGKELAQELTYNLIQNAVRYNKIGGSVDVSVEHIDGKIVFVVKDTGIGIPKKHQKRIFERFYRVDKSRSKELGGTGLGLSIVKHICKLSGGDLKLESKKNVGTMISVSWVN